MHSILGILLVDSTEILIRIYKMDHDSFNLIKSHSLYLPPPTSTPLLAGLSSFMQSDAALAVDTWIGLSRAAPTQIIQCLSQTLGFPIETLSSIREQELLCYGLVAITSRRTKVML